MKASSRHIDVYRILLGAFDRTVVLKVVEEVGRTPLEHVLPHEDVDYLRDVSPICQYYCEDRDLLGWHLGWERGRRKKVGG